MIVDIILIALVIMGYFIGAKRGFVKSVWKTAAWLVTIILVWALATPFSQLAAETPMYQSLNNKISEKIIEVYDEEASALPEYLESAVGDETQIPANTADAVSKIVTNACTYIILFILIRIIIGIAFHILDVFVKLPVISFTNAIAGGALGTVNVLIVVLLLLAALKVANIQALTELIQSSQIVKYLYNNNILLKLFI